MPEIESRQVRRARLRREAAAPRLNAQKPTGNRAARRAQRPDDAEMIMRPTSMNAAASLRRARRDSRIRLGLRPARGMVHQRYLSRYRFTAMHIMQMIFLVAAKRAELRREAAAAAA
jgi:hypothetical protein